MRVASVIVLAAAAFAVAYVIFDLVVGGSLALLAAVMVAVVAGVSFGWALR